MSKTTLLHRLVAVIGTAYLHFVGKTSFVRTVDHPSYLSYRRQKKRLIYALWHNTQVFLAYHHRGEKVSLMVSQSKDGEYIAQVMKYLGLEAVRGSSSFGGRKALRDMIHLLEEGKQVGFTPDGPRGPVYSVTSGVIGAAQMSGAPIIPVTVRCSRKIVFKSWDRFIMPLPFGSIVVAHGAPIWIGRDEDHEKAKQKVKQALHKIEEEAELALGVIPSWGMNLLGLFLYWLYLGLGILIVPLLLPFAFVKYGFRRSLRHIGERLSFGQLAPAKKPTLWFHAASLGEWQALRPLLKKFQTVDHVSLFVTASTPEAKKIISQQEPSVSVSLLPLDLPWIMPRFIRRVNPSALILIETELWPHMIQTCSNRHIPVLLANGRLSRKSLVTWNLFKPFPNRFMSQIAWFFVRSEQDGRNFCLLKASPFRVTTVGNMKCDNLRILSWEDKQKRRRELFRHPEGVYVAAGSTWPTEEEMLLQILKKPIQKKIRLILAPRRPERFKDVEKLLESHPHTWSKWSLVKNIGEWTTDVLLVDTLGDLKDLYAACDIAVIGGTMVPKGGQNPLEPASARVPLLFGSSMENFAEEAMEFKRKGAARQVRNSEDLMMDLLELINDEPLRRSMGESAANVVLSTQGAVDRTFEGIRTILGV